MRPLAFLVTALCGLLAANLAFGQQAGNPITGEHRDVGKVETRIMKYEQALGVVSKLTRQPRSDVECDGVCYFPSSSSKSVFWKCEADRKCDLRCTVNPPVGGCD